MWSGIGQLVRGAKIAIFYPQLQLNLQFNLDELKNLSGKAGVNSQNLKVAVGATRGFFPVVIRQLGEKSLNELTFATREKIVQDGLQMGGRAPRQTFGSKVRKNLPVKIRQLTLSREIAPN